MSKNFVHAKVCDSTGDWEEKERWGKNYVRPLLLGHCHRPIRLALMLPGIDLCCVKELHKKGVITNNTEVICVERQREVAKHIRPGLRRLNIHGEVLQGELENLDLDEITCGRKFDFTYLDWCGPVGANRYKFMCRLGPYLTHDAILAATTVILIKSQPFYAGATNGKGLTPIDVANFERQLKSVEGGTMLEEIVAKRFSDHSVKSLALYAVAIKRKMSVKCMYNYNENNLERKKGGVWVSSFLAQLGQQQIYNSQRRLELLASQFECK